MSGPTTIPQSTISSIFGAGLIGIILFATTFGLYSSQVHSYFNKYSKDALWMKLLVVGIWCNLALQYALNVAAIYTYLIDDFGQDAKLARASWDWLAYVLLTSVTSIGVQMFFARRLFHLLHNKAAKYILVGFTVTLSMVGFIFGVFMTVKTIDISMFSQFTQVSWGIDVWLGSNVACDLCISTGMVYGLHTSRTGIKSTDRLINKLIGYSVRTGVVTSIVEIFCLATFAASGFHFGHILVIFPLSGLYAISFLSNLHARVPNTPGLTPTSGGVVTASEMTRSFGNAQSRFIASKMETKNYPLDEADDSDAMVIHVHNSANMV